jgi:lysyl-tRNA synthetase class 2
MLELYEAQADYRRMMEIAEQMLEFLAREINGTTKVTFRGQEYDLKAPFPRLGYTDLFRQHNGCAFDDAAGRAGGARASSGCTIRASRGSS